MFIKTLKRIEIKKKNIFIIIILSLILSLINLLLFFTFLHDNIIVNNCIKLTTNKFNTKKEITSEFSKCINSFNFNEKEKKDIINKLYFPLWEKAENAIVLGY